MGVLSRVILSMLFIELFLLGFGLVDTSDAPEWIQDAFGMELNITENTLDINESAFALFNTTGTSAATGSNIIGTTIRGIGVAFDTIKFFFKFAYAPVHVMSKTGVHVFLVATVAFVWTFMYIIAIMGFIRGIANP